MLVQTAGLDIPLVDELAADIFMGRLSDKFAQAVQQTDGSLYATYFRIDSADVKRLPMSQKSRRNHAIATDCLPCCVRPATAFLWECGIPPRTE